MMAAPPTAVAERQQSAKRTSLWLLAYATITILTLWRIASTQSAFTQTNDESAHIACGMEWLDRGTYDYETQHPPLARIAAASLPYLSGVRATGASSMWVEGNNLLHSTGDYRQVLTLSRRGMLPFFALLATAVTLWGWMLYGPVAALAALIALCGLPVVLGHASLAATDMPFAATFCTALLAFFWWLRRRDTVAAATVGVATALSLVSKFSFAVFFPPCALVLLALDLAERRRTGEPWRMPWRPLLLQTALAATLAGFVVFAVYRFALEPLRQPADPPTRLDMLVGSQGPAHDALYAFLESPYFPFTRVLSGFYAVYDHVASGHRGVFLGEIRQHGVWYYYPVMLLAKTPLSFLVLVSFSAPLLLRRRGGLLTLGPLLCAAMLLVCALPSSINIGVRHVLPIYPLLALVTGFGAAEMIRQGLAGRASAVVLLGLTLLSGVAAHPHYIVYNNLLAETYAQYWGSDSDLDWGQYVYELKAELQRVYPERVSVAYFGSADLSRHDLPEFQVLPPRHRVTGWVAISPEMLVDDRTNQPPYDGYAWLAEYKPVSHAGRIPIYYIPPE
jgi:4-amino-4-deoxy-L-arabinose transferase-like glycosyltransferase